MAAALLNRIRGQAYNSGEDSYDDIDYRSLSDTQARPRTTEQQAPELGSDQPPPVRPKRRGRRIVFPLSAAGNVERSGKTKFSPWSHFRHIFPTQRPQNEETHAGSTETGVANNAFTRNERSLSKSRASGIESNTSDGLPKASTSSHSPADGPHKIVVTAETPDPLPFPDVSKRLSEACDGDVGTKRQHRTSVKQRTERARQRGYPGCLQNELLPPPKSFSSIYPKAFGVWEKKRCDFLSNKIKTTKYTILSFIPKNLFEQFHRIANFYFLLIIILNFMPMINAFDKYVAMIPLLVVLSFQGVKDIVEDFVRYRSDNRVNNLKTLTYNMSDDKYHTVKWKNVQVGDIVRLFCNRVIPADVLLLHSSDEHGVCYIETSNMDGETNLKQRSVCKGVRKNFHAKDFKSIIQCEKPNSQIDRFTGNIISPTSKESVNKENLLLRGCVIRNTDYVEGIVLYAGHETKAMLNNNGPRYKRSKLERRMNLDVIWCVILLIVMCTIGAVGNSIWAANQAKEFQTTLYVPPKDDGDVLSPALSGFYMFWTMVILLQVLIPISLYVSIEFVKVGQVFFISNDIDLYHPETDRSLECRALNITEDLGQVQYVFSDKTGTLTENSMVFRRCTVGGVDYPHAANAARIESNEPAPPELDPTSEVNEEILESIRQHKKLERAQSAQPFSRTNEHRASYRRPASSSVRGLRAHHRRNPSSLSVKQLQRTMGEDETNDGRPSRSAPGTPAHLRRGVTTRNSAHRLPHKHHRRNISAVSAKEIMSNMATDDSDVERVLEDEEHDDVDVEDEFLEADVTPDPVLYKELESVAHNPMGPNLSSDKARILDFFINLAICNTVVLSTDNEKPRLKQEDMQTSTPPAKFRSLMDDSIESDNETESNVNTVSGGLRSSTRRSSSRLDDIEEVQKLSFSNEYLKQIRYEAESPDEAALVYAAHAYGCSLAHRSKNTATVTLPKSNQTISFEVLHTLVFDSTRKRMSVVVRDPRTNQYILYSKGADSTILNLLRNPKDVLQDDDSGVGSEHSFSSHQESNSKKVIQDTNHLLNQYARTGLRTLCIAKRVLTKKQYFEWAEMLKRAEVSMEDREQKVYDCYVNLEKDLELLGATGIEDRLQDGVPETIESLRRAGMQVWVITGDKQETAVNIGYSCRLIEQNDEIIYLNAQSQEELGEMLDRHTEQQNDIRGVQPDIGPDPDASLLSFTVRFRANSQPVPSNHSGNHPPLGIVIDGKTLDYALDKDMRRKFVNLARRCHSVLVCRATPLQKGEVVKLVKEELHVMTLAIGDGANDVSMIQVADIGIGISGQEGMQAVMSSDFAMARFRFLQKLLLVHGHWNYARLAAMVLYFFYKNAAFVFLIFWFQFFCGYSGANPIEQWYLLLYSLAFTSVPPLVNGVLDQDVSAATLLRKPKLYMQGINNELYRARTFWITMFDAIYQSVPIFFIPYYAYWDTNVDLISWGTPVTAACMFANLIHLGIETKTWTWMHWLSHAMSVILFFAFSLIYDVACPSCPPYWVTETLVQTSNFWFSIVLATMIAVLPRYLVRALQSNLWASETQKERVRERTGGKDTGSTITTASTSMNGTGTSGGSSSTYQNVTYDERGGDTATDALTYDFADQPQYVDIQQKANTNNHNNTGKRRRSVEGLANPAYADDSPVVGTRSSDVRRRPRSVSEPETGEKAYDTSEATRLNAPTQRHATGHHVAFEPGAAKTIGDQDQFGSMRNVTTDSDRASVQSGMTPVEDSTSVASDASESPHIFV